MAGAHPATARASAPAGSRIDWIDAARGLAIILVVIGHVGRGLVSPGLMDNSLAWRFIDGSIYAFHMPAFFLLAGMHAQRGLERSADAFLIDKLKTIVWPYLLWSLLHGGLALLLAGNVNQPISGADLIAIAWQPIAQYWFLYALALCHLVALVLWPHRRLLIVAAILFAMLSAQIGAGQVASHAMKQFPFFLIGLLAGPWLMAHARGLRRSARAIAYGGFVLLLIACQILWQWQPGAAGSAVLFYLIATSGIAGLLALAIILDDRPHWLIRLGRASMAIFVAHTFFAAGLRIAVVTSGLAIPLPALFAASVAIGLAGPYLLYVTGGRMGVNTILGLGKYVRR